MFNRLIKIISCILIIAIIISIAIAPIYANAIAAPIVIGGAALAIGGLAWVVCNAMGVNLTYSNLSTQDFGNWFNPYYQVQTSLTTSDFTFIKAFKSGYDALRLSLAAYQAIKNGSSDFIDSNNIQSNTSGTVALIGSLDGCPAYDNNGVPTTEIYHFSGPGTFYFGNGYVVNDPNTGRGTVYNSKGVGYNGWGYYITSCYLTYNSGYGRIYANCTIANGRSVSGNITDSSLVILSSSSYSYNAGNIDTTYGDNAQNYVNVLFPTSQTLDQQTPLIDILNYINGLALQNDQNLDIELDTEPAPQPTPIPIPSTPLGDVPYDEWYDTFGQSVFDAYNHLNLGQDALITVNQGISDGVDDIVGLQTDIDETLQDGIVYGSRTADATEDIATELTNVGSDVGDIADDVVVIVDEMGNVVDVLEGIEAKEYINGQTLGNIKTDTQAISTELSNVADDVDDLTDILPDVATLPDIKTATESLTDALPDIAVLPDIKTATETLTDALPDIATLPDIKTATETIEDTLTDTLPDIITKIDDATTTITDEIPKLDDICENIDEAPLKDIDTGVTRLPSFLLPYIADLRDALGIWHYVTEWVGYINTTFSFILGVLTGTSILTPIYASIAGFICIRAYRRMCN